MPRIDYGLICTTKEEAEEKKAHVEAAYPPQGYGTSLKVVEKEDEDGTYYVVEGYRYDSCD